MRKKNKNVYMGVNSTAQIPVFNKVDTPPEIILNAFATSYDALDNIMLTKRSGFFDKTTMQGVNGRFGILRMMCMRTSPEYLQDIEAMYNVVSENYKGNISDIQALEFLKSICLKHNLDPGRIDDAILRINQAENINQSGSNDYAFGQVFPFWVQSPKKRIGRNKNYNRRVG